MDGINLYSEESSSADHYARRGLRALCDVPHCGGNRIRYPAVTEVNTQASDTSDSESAFRIACRDLVHKTIDGPLVYLHSSERTIGIYYGYDRKSMLELSPFSGGCMVGLYSIWCRTSTA